MLLDVAFEPRLTHETTGEVAVTVAERLATAERSYWLALFRAHGVPAAPCVRVVDLFDDPHLTANNLWWDADHPRWGTVRQTGAVATWREMSQRIDRRAPVLGEHTIECLRELGVLDERIKALLGDRVIVDAGSSQQQGPNT